MDVVLISILSGISYGIVLFLVAAGLSFVLGLMGIVNIAHGALVMTGAYAGINVAKASGSLILGGLAGALLAGLVGLLLERGFLRNLYKFQLEADRCHLRICLYYRQSPSLGLWRLAGRGFCASNPARVRCHRSIFFQHLSHCHHVHRRRLVSRPLVDTGPNKDRRRHQGGHGRSGHGGPDGDQPPSRQHPRVFLSSMLGGLCWSNRNLSPRRRQSRAWPGDDVPRGGRCCGRRRGLNTRSLCRRFDNWRFLIRCRDVLARGGHIRTIFPHGGDSHFSPTRPPGKNRGVNS